jgi:hypothetical protein
MGVLLFGVDFTKASFVAIIGELGGDCNPFALDFSRWRIRGLSGPRER